ncbi:ricin-type beta-trefoil lectin domain protein [Streptomyces sp. NPDC017056]|uniref:ricin-type beta-trefoil lectin domain protein n=1 Tax=Streptomyces sp. NPDC017056 TaxID=3364973 RepID=UPI00379FC8A2
MPRGREVAVAALAVAALLCVGHPAASAGGGTPYQRPDRYEIRSSYGNCLDATRSPQVGTVVMTWRPCHQTPAQSWQVLRVKGGFQRIVHDETDLCLGREEEGYVTLQTCAGDPAERPQRWVFTSADEILAIPEGGCLEDKGSGESVRMNDETKCSTTWKRERF